MKPIIPLILVAAYSSVAIHAYRISGKVTDGYTNVGLPYSTIKAISKTDSVLAVAQSGAEGEFCIESDMKPDSVAVECAGYIGSILSVDSLASLKEVVIRLEPYSSVELEGITVSASTVTTKGNVQTFIITDQMRRNTINAMDLINKLPGFIVDPISESVSAGSATDIKIIVDGQKVSQSYYRSINPARIKSMEFIRNSSGRYSQYPAILNIVLKKGYEGIDINLNGRYFQFLSGVPTDNETLSANLASSYRRWNYFISGEFTRGTSTSNTGSDLDIFGKTTVTRPMSPVDDPDKDGNRRKWLGNAGVSVRLTPRQTLTAQFLYDHADNHTRESSQSIISGESGITDIDSRYETNNYVAGISYRNSVSKRFSLSADVTYNWYDIRQWQDIRKGGDYGMTSVDGDKDYMNGYAEAYFKLNKSLSLNVSYEYTHRNYNTVNNHGSAVAYMENRHRPVVDFRFSHGSFSGNVGVSYLDILARNDETSSHQRTFLPRVNLHWEPMRNLALSVEYYSSTFYPNLDRLSAQRWLVSDRVWQSGNPDLEASTMNYLETRLKLWRNFTLTYMFRHSSNDVATSFALSDTAEPSIVGSYINTRFIHQYAGLLFSKELSGEVDIDVNTNCQWYSRKTDGTVNHGRTFYFDVSANWNIFKSDYILSANLFLRDDRMPLPQGVEKTHWETCFLSCSKMFLNNRLKVNVGVNLPLHLLPHVDRTSIITPDFRYERSEDFWKGTSWKALVNIQYVFSKGRTPRKSGSMTFESEKD